MRLQQMVVDNDDQTKSAVMHTRTFLLVTIAAGLTAWDIGFEAGAFENFSYQRVFTVFVLSVIVLVASFRSQADPLIKTPAARTVLLVPFLYLVADLLLLTDSELLTWLLLAAMVVSLPYTLYLLARLLGGDYFSLQRQDRVIASILVLSIALVGFYVGYAHERFVSCEDFQRNGDFVPSTCLPS